MNDFLGKLVKWDNTLAKGEAVALIAVVVVMTLVVFVQVVYRYALTQPLYWSEELARYLFVWLSMLGSALGLQKRGHFGLDVLFKMIPIRRRRFAALLIHLLMGIVVFVILVEGVMLVGKTISQESPAMGISMSWAYACLPIGAALMAVHLMVIFLKDAFAYEREF